MVPKRQQVSISPISSQVSKVFKDWDLDLDDLNPPAKDFDRMMEGHICKTEGISTHRDEISYNKIDLWPEHNESCAFDWPSTADLPESFINPPEYDLQLIIDENQNLWEQLNLRNEQVQQQADRIQALESKIWNMWKQPSIVEGKLLSIDNVIWACEHELKAEMDWEVIKSDTTQDLVAQFTWQVVTSI